MNDAARGARALLDAARLLAGQRAWWPLVLAPAVVTGIGFGLAIVAAWQLAGPTSDAAAAWVGEGGGWLARAARAVVSAAAVVAELVVFAFLALIAGKIAAGPFLDLLSERVERYSRPDRPLPTLTLATLLTEASRGAAHSALALLLYVAFACPLTLVQIVPVVGSAVAFPLGVLVSAALVAREAFDYPMSRRRWTFLSKLAALRRTAGLSLGLGLGLVAVLAVPGVNLLAMPIGVIAATRLFLDLDDDGAYGRTPTAP